eukprot:6717653-Prymnesium_polylepis.1
MPTSEEEEPEDWAVAEQDQCRLGEMVDDLISWRFLYFLNVPKVKFVVHQLVLVLYTALPLIFLIHYDMSDPPTYGHSYGLPANISGWEVLFWVLAVGNILANYEQIEPLIPESQADDSIAELARNLVEGCRLHFRDFWKSLALVVDVLVCVGMVLRLSDGHNYEEQVAARSVYAVVVALLGVRFLEILRISQSVGILSIIVVRMIISDCLPFALILIVLSTPFGIALCILQPRSVVGEPYIDVRGGLSDMSLSVVTFLDSPFYAPWLALVGDFDIRSLIEDARGTFIVQWLLPLLYYVYLLLALIVLLNLLIAAMSATFEDLSSVATLEWKYARAQLVVEYKDAKFWPSPLNIVHLLGRAVSYLLAPMKPPPAPSGFKCQLGPTDELRVQACEVTALKACHAKHTLAHEEESALSTLSG